MKRLWKRRIIFQAVAIVFLIGLCSFFYAQFITDGSREKTLTVLSELSAQNAKILQAKVEKGLDDIELLAETLADFDLVNQQEGIDYLRKVIQTRNYLRLGIASLDGSTVTTDNQSFDIADREYFQQSLLGKAMVSNTLKDKAGNKEIIVYSTPIWQDGHVSAVLFATYSMDEYRKALSTPTFNGAGYNYVVTADGERIVGTDHENSFGPYFDNIYDEIERADPSNQEVSAHMQQALENGESGAIIFRNKVDKYVYYEPIGINDWYLLTVVPQSIVTQQTSSTLLWSYGFIALFVLLLLFLVLWNVRSRLTESRKLERIAYADELTGGISYLKFKLEAEMLRQKHPLNHYVMVSLDIDNFQYINDVYGYQEGDRFLQFLWNVLNRAIREDETMARVVDDHFVAFIAYTKDIAELDQRFSSFIRNLRAYRPEKNSGNYKPALSAGVYVVEPNVTDIDTMVNRAKIPQKRIKGISSAFAVYSNDLYEEMIHNKQLENYFETALKNKEFLVYYQPKFDLKKNCFDGAEALVRWRKPDGTLLSPNRFIPLFEKNGDIIALDQYVLDVVCRDIRAWLDMGLSVPPISVNVSRRQLLLPGFVEKYVSILQAHNIPNSYIQLEFTESMVVENEQILKKVASELHDYGILVQMDDFGSGYSSLSMLKNVPLDVLKLDKSLSDDLEQDERSKAVITGSISLANVLHMNVTAEGVETRGQFDFLEQAGCDCIQGFFCAKPMDHDQYQEILRKNQRSTTN